VLYLCYWHRPAEQKALYAVAASVTQKVELGLGFYAFNHH